MTAIIVLYLNKGKQVLVLSDTKHTYPESIKKDTKIKILDKLLICGAGFDDCIGEILKNVNNSDDLASCVNKIILSKESSREHLKYEPTKNTGNNILSSEFFIIDKNNLKGNTIRVINSPPISNFDMIGSGTRRLGDIQNTFRGYYEKEFSEITKKAFFREIILAFLDVSKYDSFTGHPAIFPIEVFVLNEGNSIKKYELEFNEELLKNPDNYSLKEEVIEND